MKNQYTIQQVATQYNINTEELIGFLNDKGVSIDFSYQKLIDPQLILELESELKRRNRKLPFLFISEDDINNFKPITKPIEFWQDANISNLEKIIYKTLSYEKSATEKIIGLTPFYWCYAKAKFNIKYSKGVNFTLFEDTVCRIIERRPGCDVNTLCHLMGFGVDTEIVLTTVKGLTTDEVIRFDGDKLYLTDKGKVDMEKKQKSKPAIKAVLELFIDGYNSQNVFAKDIFANSKSADTASFEFDSLGLEEVKSLAEVQQPTYQSSKSGFVIQEADIQSESIVYRNSKFVAIVTEDLANSERNKIWIFDPYRREISKPLTRTATNNQTLYQIVTDKLYSEIRADVVENVVKGNDQIRFESLLVSSARDDKSKKAPGSVFQHFLSPDSLDTVQFEDEMERLFDACEKELWLIFPFAMGYIIEKRIKLIEKALKNNCSVFVCFSQNENKEFGAKVVIDKKAIELFEKLSSRNLKFFFAELPKFHEKRVFAVLNDKLKCEYSGSHNYLSFFVHRAAKGVRRENMQRLIWSETSDKEFAIRRKEFAKSLAERLADEVNADMQVLAVISKDDLDLRKKYYSSQIKKLDAFSTFLSEDEIAGSGLLDTISQLKKFI